MPTQFQQIKFYITEMGGCQNTSVQDQILDPNAFQGILIICKTWNKTFSNLFDYNAASQNLTIKKFNIINETRIVKTNGKYSFQPYDPKDKKNQKLDNVEAIIEFVENSEKKKNGQQKSFNIQSKFNKTKQQPWLAVKSLPSKKYTIKEGDMLRIGKQKVRVKQMADKIQETKQQDEACTAVGIAYENLTRQGKPLVITEQQIKNYVCRFCLDEGQVGNPLMAPCNCAGSSKYVHLKCVQIWLTKTINPRLIGKSTIITWKPLVCELCHKALPFKVYLDGKRYFTVNIPKPKKPYLVLNPIYKQKEKDKSKIYYLISFAEQKEMVIGRKTDTDILISQDSTVSRHHSKIVFQQTNKGQGKFCIYDNESKFGTLVLLRKFFTMKSQINGISIQIGGDLLELRVGRGSKAIQNNFEDVLNKTESDNSDDAQQEQEEQVNNPNNQELQNENNEPRTNKIAK